MGKKAKQTTLPGTIKKEAAVEKAAAAYVEARDERMALTKREVETQAALVEAMRKAGLTAYRCTEDDLEVVLVDVATKAKVRRIKEESTPDDGDE